MEGDGGQDPPVRGHRQISTHALTWRATFAVVLYRDKLPISTHALTWRATYR